jgi:hypothetical protein
MTRNAWGGSRSLQRRAFGSAGSKGVSGVKTAGYGQGSDLPPRNLGQRIPAMAAGAWKPRPGRIYGFPLMKEPEGK